ncbi:hypothetical protein GCM10009745_07820 [Kribbella yunnanensis]|uniref:Uncharacterized protein n=1 Tax=Kribbella yunnanensis TaxID=190194 RepID=A0ABN2GA35_9ACTN
MVGGFSKWGSVLKEQPTHLWALGEAGEGAGVFRRVEMGGWGGEQVFTVVG